MWQGHDSGIPTFLSFSIEHGPVPTVAIAMSINKFGNGPKDWMPKKPFQASSLLSKEDAGRINDILRSVSKASETDVKWLRDIIEKLALLKPDEFDFPKYAALVNPIACNAFAMRYHRTEVFRNTVALSFSLFTGGTDLLNLTTNSQVCDAILLIRPWIRLGAQTGKEALEIVRKGLVTFTLDGEKLCEKASIDEFLIDENGYGVRKKPFALGRIKTSCLFGGCGLNSEHQADASKDLGIMMVNGTHVVLTLHGQADAPGTPVSVTAGLVAATYTTKA
jgi:hypothetical protein